MSIACRTPRRSALRLLTSSVAIIAAGAPLSAQVCLASKLDPPVDRLEVRIEACDYLSALAEPRHPRDCQQRRQSVRNDATSRVHVLERRLADSLTRVFAANFGFLRWRTTPPTGRWTIRVQLQQPRDGLPPVVTVALLDGDSLRAVSDAEVLEQYDKVDLLFDEQQGQRATSLDRTGNRWLAEMTTLITSHDGAVRTRWIRSVLKHVPVMSGSIRPVRDGQFAFATLPIRDSDIRAPSDKRPEFEWRVGQIQTLVTTSTPPDTVRDPGSFVMGDCQQLTAGYSCRLNTLLYGSARFATAEETAVFVRDKSPTFVAPMTLYVTNYIPARQACATVGSMPQ